MVDDGTMTIGETCAPQTLTKRSIVNGELTIQEETVYGRKIPSMSIRIKLLQKHEPYMQLKTDMELKSITTQELIQHYQKLHIKLPDEITDENLSPKVSNWWEDKILLLSSSLEDQTALISDRIECIKELTAQITSKTGITVTDKLFFFTGDKPAAQFECGTQQGATTSVDLVGVGNKNGRPSL